MDSETLLSFFAVVIAALLLIFHKSKTRQNKHGKQRPPVPPLPPSPPAFPIIGHLHLFKDPLHRSFHELSAQYGPILFLRMGMRSLLIISSPKAAEECFTKSDLVFANRPGLLVGKILGYNWTSFGWAPYGDHWRNLRKFTTLELFSTQGIQRAAPIRLDEIQFMLKDILNSPKVDSAVKGESGWMKVDLNQPLFRLPRCVMMRIVCGKRWDKGPLDELFLTTAMVTVYDFFPVLRWIVGFNSLEKKLTAIQKGRDGALNAMIEDVRSRKAREGDDDERMRTSTTVLEQLLEVQRADPEYYTDDIVKSNIALLFAAGTDTSARTMEWAMSLLLNNPTTLHKAQAEIDARMSAYPNRLVDNSDIQSFPYLRCIINETLRLFPVAPLLIPRCSSTDVTVSGYHIPKDTVLLINAWAIHRDPSMWDEPMKFRPERFMAEEMEGDHIDGFKFIPFGGGRRVCPGSNFALRTMMLTLATLIQCFDWKRVDESESIDLSEEIGSGVTMPKSEPLHAICKIRPRMNELLSKI